ncbi:hypothetical protein SDC9_184029 [bioreactor metagenome]|uniref:Uncharacterized protein n=1 Tax=bioreactor metagenome TaxID=1076179 RepID=A0A645HCR6_9ZZZZ
MGPNKVANTGDEWNTGVQHTAGSYVNSKLFFCPSTAYPVDLTGTLSYADAGNDGTKSATWWRSGPFYAMNAFLRPGHVDYTSAKTGSLKSPSRKLLLVDAFRSKSSNMTYDENEEYGFYRFRGDWTGTSQGNPAARHSGAVNSLQLDGSAKANRVSNPATVRSFSPFRNLDADKPFWHYDW